MIFFSVFNFNTESERNNPITIKKYITSALGNNPSIKETERSKKAIEAAMFQDQKIFLVTQKDPQIEDPGFVQLFQVGTIAYIKQVVKLPDNLLRVLVGETAVLIGPMSMDGAEFIRTLPHRWFWNGL